MDPGRDADRRIGGPGEGAPPNSPAASEESVGRAPNGQHADASQGTPQLSLRHAAKAFGAVHAIVACSIDLYGGGDTGPGSTSPTAGNCWSVTSRRCCTVRRPPGTPG